jgi:hypothetical protein
LHTAEGLFNKYQMGFGHMKLFTAGFDNFHYVNTASFLQIVAPHYTHSLGIELTGDWSSDGSQSEGSLEVQGENPEYSYATGEMSGADVRAMQWFGENAPEINDPGRGIP